MKLALLGEAVHWQQVNDGTHFTLPASHAYDLGP